MCQRMLLPLPREVEGKAIVTGLVDGEIYVGKPCFNYQLQRVPTISGIEKRIQVGLMHETIPV